MQARSAQHAQGIDVSHWQGTIDWTQVRQAGISFVFIKATEGTVFVDSFLKRNLAGAHAAGLLVGAYHFLKASTETEAIAEADFYLNSLDGCTLDLPPVLDAEDKANTADAAIAWMNEVLRLTGAQPLLYTYPTFIDRKFTTPSLGQAPLWYANYSETTPRDRGPWTAWTFLQFTDKGKIAGISGIVDLNEYSGTEEELMVRFGAKTVASLSKEDADVAIAILQAAWGLDVHKAMGLDIDRDKIHKAADAIRVASGQGGNSNG